MKNFNNWVIPNRFYQVDDKAGGDPPPAPDPNLEEEVELDPSSKLADMELEIIDQLMDREDVDQDKLLEWMKSRNEEDTLESILIKADETDKDKSTSTDTEDDEGKADIDHKEKEDLEDPTKKADDKPGDDKTASTDAKGKTDAAVTDDGKTKSKALKITDEYITKQVQNFRDQWKDDVPDVRDKKIAAIEDILNGVKGSEMDQKALKNYINAQMYIKTIKSPFDRDWKPDQKVVGDPEYIKQATEQKQKMILTKIREKYPEFPEEALDDDDALRDFEDSLGRRKFNEYDAYYKAVTDKIDSEYDRYVHISQNWESIAESTIRTDVELFKAKLARYNLTPKDLGIDTLDLRAEDLYNEYLWKNVLFVNGETNNPNPDVLTFMDDVIPIVKPKAVYSQLMEMNYDQIIQAKEHKARQQGFKTGINNMEDPSTSNLPGKEHRDKIEIEAEDFENDDLTPDQIQEKLDRLKSGIAQSSGAKVVTKR